jgi:hypothetical protein
MRLWRVLPWDPSAEPDQPGGPLWIPRNLQGRGRHDDPARYGCLYLAARDVGAVAELLAPFRGRPLTPAVLHRAGPPAALAALELGPDAILVDLDEPATLLAERLRPSQVATRERPVTQTWASRIHREHREATGLRWWSVLEASWLNVTLFDRGTKDLAVEDVRPLALDDPVLREAASFLGLVAP